MCRLSLILEVYETIQDGLFYSIVAYRYIIFVSHFEGEEDGAYWSK